MCPHMFYRTQRLVLFVTQAWAFLLLLIFICLLITVQQIILKKNQERHKYRFLFLKCSLWFFCPRRILLPLSRRPDELTSERLDGDPHPQHRVPLAAVRGRAGVRGGLHHGRGALAADGPARPLRLHPAVGAQMQEAQGGEGGVRHPQGHRSRQLR